MCSDYDVIINKLAYIRDEIFDETDLISDDGCDLVPNYAASPYEVLCGVETKLLRQQKIIEALQERLRSAEEESFYNVIGFNPWE